MIQNSAARVLTKTKRRDHITPILKSLHWLPISYRIYFKALLLVFKSLKGVGPNYLHDMFKQYSQIRSLRSQHKQLLLKPTVRTKQGEAAFSHYGVHLWNQLPETIKTPPLSPFLKQELRPNTF